MPDCFEPEKRSWVMSRIRSKGTSPEKRLGELMKKWFPETLIFTNSRELPGTPDFALPEHRVAVFVDGCFFHGCPIHYREPKENSAYWIKKLRENRRRDKRVNKQLRDEGWIVVRIWEHELKGKRIVGRERVRRRLRYAVKRSVGSEPIRKVAESAADYD